MWEFSRNDQALYILFPKTIITFSSWLARNNMLQSGHSKSPFSHQSNVKSWFGEILEFRNDQALYLLFPKTTRFFSSWLARNNMAQSWHSKSPFSSEFHPEVLVKAVGWVKRSGDAPLHSSLPIAAVGERRDERRCCILNIALSIGTFN